MARVTDCDGWLYASDYRMHNNTGADAIPESRQRVAEDPMIP